MALTERYTIDQKLGEGGFGAVFRGTHRQMSTPVAIKVLHAQHASSAETVARFEQEARRSASLKHPNTIRVFDFGRDDDGSLFLVMELLEGAPLSHHIKQGRLAVDRVVHILAQALSALDEAHQQGLVHRDLKPDNIFLTRLGKDPDFVKVLDFGIAKALDGNAKLTASGANGSEGPRSAVAGSAGPVKHGPKDAAEAGAGPSDTASPHGRFHNHWWGFAHGDVRSHKPDRRRFRSSRASAFRNRSGRSGRR